MTLKQACIVLRRYEDWRLGVDGRAMKDAFPEDRANPRLISQAISLILSAHDCARPIANCRDCRRFDITGCKVEVKGECKSFTPIEGRDEP